MADTSNWVELTNRNCKICWIDAFHGSSKWSRLRFLHVQAHCRNCCSIHTTGRYFISPPVYIQVPKYMPYGLISLDLWSSPIRLMELHNSIYGAPYDLLGFVIRNSNCSLMFKSNGIFFKHNKLIITHYLLSWKITSVNMECFAIYMPDLIKFCNHVTAQWLPKVEHVRETRCKTDMQVSHKN